MCLNFKKDIQTIKNFWETLKNKFPFLSSCIKVVLIILKWLIIVFVFILIIIFLIGLYNNYRESKRQALLNNERAYYEKLLGESQIEYQKCLDKTVKNEELTKEWKQMNGWKEWRCGDYWELFWVDWIMTKHPELCSEYNSTSIKFFLSERMKDDDVKLVKYRICP